MSASNERVFSVLVVGDSGVGKSSLLNRLQGNGFDPVIASTYGVAYIHNKIEEEGFEVKLNIYDTAGQERFRAMVPQFFRNIKGCMIVFDISNRKSFEAVKYWLHEIEDKAPPGIALLVVGNKVDL